MSSLNASKKTALVSIHDVMPETLSQVRGIVRFFEQAGIHRFTMLVVPGRNWTPSDVNQLRAWQEKKVELAAHGWRHRIIRMTTAWHRLHGQLISRNEAEHLSLDDNTTAEIVSRSYQWFSENGLNPPKLYVPPAWAMGRLSRRRIERLPFAFYETHAGVYDARIRRFYLMPVTGYMADTRIRTAALRAVNAINLGLPGPATRIAVHPQDLQLPLKPDLIRHLRRFQRFESYVGLMMAAMQTRPRPLRALLHVSGMTGPGLMSTRQSKSES
ncbi:MAG: polysaccharide deacetylase family protein [Thermodesulfobacteriota bacterium]|nr:polysaccharide deacetylase family protein [Thermodesulfobacteriota bacterium]